jgi:hypothetical protein
MGLREYSKPIKRRLRELMTEAYERELHRELLRLDQHFTAWRRGEISNGELSDRVHQYETGPSRDLFKHYNQTPHDLLVAYAIVAGILSTEEVAPEVLDAFQGPLQVYQDLKERHELREPGN